MSESYSQSAYSEVTNSPLSSRHYRYLLVDVFTERRFSGNPLAVFTDARGLNTDIMQRIARELSHPETTFVFPPADNAYDYSVRIFTPHAELPTAGQSTIGTAFALAQERRVQAPLAPQRLVFDEVAGPVSVSMVSPVTTMKQQLPRFGSLYPEPQTAAAILSLKPTDLQRDLPVQAVASSIPYLIIPVRELEALQRIRLRADIWERTVRNFEAPNIFAFTLQTENPQTTARARMFAPALGIMEAPATESASGPLAAYLVRHKLVPDRPEQSLSIEQGAEIGRPSCIHVHVEQRNGELGSLRIGGQCVLVGEGVIYV
jgi:trans-2,3-dihydro-3-hydroxyanthranilate isomerase